MRISLSLLAVPNPEFSLAEASRNSSHTGKIYTLREVGSQQLKKDKRRETAHFFSAVMVRQGIERKSLRREVKKMWGDLYVREDRPHVLGTLDAISHGLEPSVLVPS